MASFSHPSEDRFQPSAKLLNKTAATGFSYLSPRPAPVARTLSHGSGYNSLPRPRPNTGGPASLSHARRKIVNSALQDYLKSLNSMTRSIVLETETVEKEHKYNWTTLDEARKEDLVNDHFMPADVRLHYDSERAASCCDIRQSPERAGGNQDLPTHQEDLMSSRDLVYRNDWSSTASQREDMSVSQPSIPNCFQDQATEKANFNRLHKQQLSFRPGHKHAVKPISLPAQSSFTSQMGSDGESPRTSDEDFEGFGGQNSGLGFQRSKLRSYSMRSKKGNGGLRNSANLRSSVRTSNRIRTSPDREETAHNEDSYPQLCRPSHSHSYSTTSTETDFDEAIDMPDEALMLDHISRKSSTEENIFNDEYQSKRTPKCNRTRRSLRSMPKIMLEQSEVHINRSLCSETTQSSSSFASSDAYMLDSTAKGEGPELFRPPSRDSLDFDSVSMAPSDASKYPMDDEEDLCRMTPDSVLSLSSGYSCRPRSKLSELAVLRNRRGNRGGSQIKVATSNFADRHTQFKNNMSSPSYPTSACTTRPTSPASSVSSIPVHWTREQDSTGHLKAPSFSYGASKHDSMAESTTSDFPCSPDHSSILSSPPNTPLAANYTANPHMLRRTLSHFEDRESGYLSSSLESFPVGIRR